MEKATFGAGCFWGVEAAFRKMSGVISTRVGYCGGQSPQPTYQDVCTDQTGHAEVVEVTFDPQRVTYNQLLEVFWTCHNPTQWNRQGPDIGTQYRSVIFYHTPEQETLAKTSKHNLQQTGIYKQNIVTQIEPLTEFWPAEEYHQQYLEKRGKDSCHM